ncbi:MAG: DUF4145 domain-containing protein [Candidatus Heimdallarchaeota archaeon]|nr:DUF4145 domain-containing protein [Candidatus Heimdallarchaeota archaeon]
MTGNEAENININKFEEETFLFLIQNVLVALEELEDLDNDKVFQVIYSKQEFSPEQFHRILKVIEFFQDSISPFPIFSRKEKEENGIRTIKIRSSDEEGFLHTCYLEFIFIIDNGYTIIPETCGCRGEIFDYLLPSILSSDISKIWLCISLQENTPDEFKERVNSLLKMYVQNNFIEAWTHIGFIAETLTKEIYLKSYPDKTLTDVNNIRWNSLLKKLENDNNLPDIEQYALLLDSLRPIRNDVTHNDYRPTSEDTEFGISCLNRIFKFYKKKF